MESGTDEKRKWQLINLSLHALLTGAGFRGEIWWSDLFNREPSIWQDGYVAESWFPFTT